MEEINRWKRYRDAKRGGPPEPRAVMPHGTWAAVRRHNRAAEKLCDECKIARREHAREMYVLRRARAMTGE